MPSLAYVFRRGAVYHFRQRLPAPLAKKLSLSHLSLSLRTTNQRVARQRTARLAALASKVFRMMDELPTVTRNQLNAIFREFASDLLLDLEAVAAKETEDPDFDIDFARIFDQAAGWAERLRAAQGIRAKLDSATRREMTDQGHGTDTHFELVELFLEDPDPATETSDLECQDYLEGVGAEVTEENIRLTRRTLHRAAAMAYFAVEKRWSAARDEDDGLMAEVLSNQADPGQAAHGWQPPAQVQLPSPLPIGSAPEDRPPLNPVSAPVQTASVEGDQSITRWTEKTIQNKAGSWNEKTGKQALQISKLFERFMTEEFSFSTLGPLRQPHLARFSEFLRHEIYKHTGKRDADFKMTIAELRDYALTKPPKMRGVNNATLNRHLNFLKQIFDYAESQGFELNAKISTKKLRQSTKDRRGRDERKPFTPAEIKLIFRQPVFAGCHGWRNADLLLPGKDIYHRALFFVPIICFYSGARREEVCAAGIDDVIIDNGPIPYLRLEPNAFRGLKNRQSTRNIPLHPELIRLGFLDYVRAIKALRYILLFPDLHSPSNSAPLGDKLGDDLRKVLNAAGITEKGKLLHSHRHGFGNTLKQKGVTVEGRADLLGHGGDTETAERYCEAFEIAAKFEMIEKLPPVTAHLPTSSIRLLPWVAEGKIAPFSQPSRSRKAKKASPAA